MELLTLAIDRIAELDEMIAQGWGDTPQPRIPSEWRTIIGPDIERALRSRQDGGKRWPEWRHEDRRLSAANNHEDAERMAAFLKAVANAR